MGRGAPSGRDHPTRREKPDPAQTRNPATGLAADAYRAGATGSSAGWTEANGECCAFSGCRLKPPHGSPSPADGLTRDLLADGDAEIRELLGLEGHS